MSKTGRKVFAISAAYLLLGSAVLGPLGGSGSMVVFWIALGIWAFAYVATLAFALVFGKKKDGKTS